jgi:hypothetical protein
MFLIISALLALIFMALATTGVGAHPRFQWMPAGLFFFILTVVWPILEKIK